MIFRSDIKLLTPNFVQVLTNSKISIFKRYNKNPKGENYSNGIVNNPRKYLLQTTQSAPVDNKIIAIKFNATTLEELTSSKRKEIDEYLKENKLKPKKEGDFLLAIAYFNSISKAAN